MRAFFRLLTGLFRVLCSIVLDAFKEKSRPSTPSTADTEDNRTALHEAGHAVTAWMCTATMRIQEISIDKALSKRAAGAAGHVSWVSAEKAHYQNTDVAWCRLVIGLAGIVGELLVFNRYRSGAARTDLEEALLLARTLAPEGVPWKIEEGKAPPFHRMFVSSISDREAEVLRLAYLMAKQLLRKHEQIYWRLVSVLLARRILREEEINRLLGARTWATLLGAIKATFV